MIVWGAKSKKTNALYRWHSKAMLVDPKTTKITIIWAEMPETNQTEENLGIKPSNHDAADLKAIESSNAHSAVENLEAAYPNVGTVEQTVKTTEPKLRTKESNVAETPDFDEIVVLETTEPKLEPLEKHVSMAQKPSTSLGSLEDAITKRGITQPNSETVAPDVAETLTTDKTAENPENLEPRLEYTASNLIEAQTPEESVEDVEIMKQDVRNMKPYLLEASSTIGRSGLETRGIEVANNDELAEGNNELMTAEEEPLNVKFLRALEKTRSMWYNDKQLAKIIKKMERGKNLKRKEFDKVYMHIRTHCQYH
jgi:hypothetical protein